MMLSCNCLNITIEIEKNEKIGKEVLELTKEEKKEIFFNQDIYVARLCNINKVLTGLIRTIRVGLWKITQCLNCEVETHAIHAEKGATYCLIYSKLLDQEAIDNIKSTDLVSTIFHVIVNPNDIVSDNSHVEPCDNKNVNRVIKDLNDVLTNYIRHEQAAVEERIKNYSDEQYELLNTLKDKAYKERESLVRIVHKAARENGNHDLSPKSPKIFGHNSSSRNSYNSSETPFSPKRPKSISTEKNEVQTDDLMFNFETDDYSEVESSNPNLDESDSEGVEEAEDIVNDASGISILHARSVSSSSSIAKSCPVDIPIFSHSMRSKNSRSEATEHGENFSPRPNEEFDIAASIKALAKSVHGDAIFGELPRPKFSTQI